MVVACGYGIEALLDHFFAIGVLQLLDSVFIIVFPASFHLCFYMHPASVFRLDTITVFMVLMGITLAAGYNFSVLASRFTKALL